MFSSALLANIIIFLLIVQQLTIVAEVVMVLKNWPGTEKFEAFCEIVLKLGLIAIESLKMQCLLQLTEINLNTFPKYVQRSY